ncbi:MBL fold metallo-hydrolase [Colwellia sp. PAMC 21821]|uniref:MBL fold metallo-hydrolase n=1 Tax=Colwellia sp. PAMC 21821 TaxID=1816219 RepID=UPI0009BF2559|nr:MBL fold metallo-hydrolase [Colwellia sp. PAMC 21821]ARD46110.1 MBL fold metallo-hydrolase [Colwellia sp. PAMC 21821]
MKSMVLTDGPLGPEQHSLLEYPITPPQADGSVVEIADGLLWLRMPMPMALDHINVYLLQDDDGWYILDTGLNTETTRQLWLTVIEKHCKSKAIKGVICTHFHYDHSGLATWLTQTFNVPLYMTYGEFYMIKTISSGLASLGNDHQLDFYHRSGLPRKDVDAMLNSCRKDPFIKLCPPSFTRLREGDVLTIGKRRWQIVIGEGHSPEHACLYCAEDKLLLAGDQLLPHISSNILVTEMEPQGQPLKYWLSSLEKLQTLDPNTLVLPAHGPVFREMHLRAKQLIQHHLEQLDILRAFALQVTEFNAYQAMKHLFKRSLSPIESMMALGETLAHLNWLESNGDLFCQRTNDTGINSYLSTDKIKEDRITL